MQLRIGHRQSRRHLILLEHHDLIGSLRRDPIFRVGAAGIIHLAQLLVGGLHLIEKLSGRESDVGDLGFVVAPREFGFHFRGRHHDSFQHRGLKLHDDDLVAKFLGDLVQRKVLAGQIRLELIFVDHPIREELLELVHHATSELRRRSR